MAVTNKQRNEKSNLAVILMCDIIPTMMMLIATNVGVEAGDPGVAAEGGKSLRCLCFPAVAVAAVAAALVVAEGQGVAGGVQRCC